MTSDTIIRDRLLKHLKTLIGERHPDNSLDSLIAAGEYIEKEFQSYGYETTRNTVIPDQPEFFNISAIIKGEEPESGCFCIGAHYDTVKDSPGADDNASAVACMLECAQQISGKPVKCDIRFIGLTLEECGFLGSAPVAKKTAQKPDEKFLGMIALEMLGFCNKKDHSQTYPPGVDTSLYPNTGDFIAIVANTASTQLAKNLALGMKDGSPALGVETLIVPGKGEMLPDVRRSDHVPFWDNNLPALMLTDTANFRNPNYHQPTDTLETLDLDFLTQVTKGLTHFLLAGGAAPPER